MSIHQNVLTKDISTITSWSPAISDGDTIITDGYYEAGDGGAVTFTVREKTNNEQVDGVLTYAIANNNNLIAEMVVENQTVHINQLGAKSVANVCFDALGNVVVNNNDAVRNGLVFSAVCTNGENEVLTEAKSNIHNLVLDKDATYFLPSIQLTYKTSFCIEGNGAMLYQSEDTENHFIQISSCENAVIRNLNVTCVSQFHTLAAIKAASISGHLKLVRVNVWSACNAVYVSGTSSSMFSAKDLRTKAIYDGVSCWMRKSNLNNIMIDAGRVGLELGETQLNCTNAQIRTAFLGLACYDVQNSMFKDISFDGTRKALKLEDVSDTVFSDITGTGIEKGFSFRNCNRILMDNSLFKSVDAPETGSANDVLLDSSENSNEIVLKNCSFDFATRWFLIASSTKEQVNLLFIDCHFHVREFPESSPYPAKIMGGIIQAEFLNCNFHAACFPIQEEIVDEVTVYAIPSNTSFFYFKLDGYHVQTHAWNFNNCRFWHDTEDGNGARLVANSPIWIDAQRDQQLAKTHVALTNSFFEDFNWTVRVFTANAGQNIVIVNPADAGTPTESAAQLGAQALENKGRFVSANNFYQYQMQATDPDSIRPAETYGVTV